jgi:hypothetical protein
MSKYDKTKKIQNFIPLLFPLKIKGEIPYAVALNKFTPSLASKGGQEKDSFYSYFSQDLYSITQSLEVVAIVKYIYYDFLRYFCFICFQICKIIRSS